MVVPAPVDGIRGVPQHREPMAQCPEVGQGSELDQLVRSGWIGGLRWPEGRLFWIPPLQYLVVAGAHD
jgi:hypothetical protein